MKTFCFLKAWANIKILLLISLIVFVMPALAFNDNDSILHRKNSIQKSKPKIITLQQQLQVFYPLDNAEYSITVCADLPVNNKPQCVYKKGETGHVFLILAKQNPLTGEVITRSFGFYPRVAVTFLIKQVRSRILDNSNREYDASIEKEVTPEEFALLLQKCIELSKKKYNLKKYNCYEYVLEVFNALPGIAKLPVSKVKFPFILGKGGSPCGLYNDLKKLISSGSSWAPYIKFGVFTSPVRNASQNLIASF